MPEEGEEWKHIKDSGDEWKQPKAQKARFFVHVVALRQMVMNRPAFAYRTDVQVLCPAHWLFQ